jgi:ribose 1,5-bisphosphate isomerase
MRDSIEETVERIKNLQVQGARNIAIAAIQAIEKLSKESDAKSKKELLRELLQAKQLLFESRETEPLMRNSIRWIIRQVKRSKKTKIRELNSIVSDASRHFLKDLQASEEKIAEIGSRRIRNGYVILTHCHSSTVTHTLEKAVKRGKSFEVICTETRPAFQGRKTAQEMLDLGLKTTFIVDSAARFLMNQVDLVVVGADAITSEGNVVNKIGTSSIALVAGESRTPFYVVTELLKFDPATMYGDYEKIEERARNEIWEKAPRNLIVRNPAFDVTRRDFIHGIICEEGIVSPHSINEVVRRTYPWVFDDLED